MNIHQKKKNEERRGWEMYIYVVHYHKEVALVNKW